MSKVSDEDATRMLATCPQQVVCVGLMEFGERHDTRTNGQHYTAADRWPTNQVSGWQAERGSRPTRATSSRGCYEETARVKFKRNWTQRGITSFMR